MVKTIEGYFSSGCGRCSKFDTPECKVNRWRPELTKLREIVLECGLTETLKWAHPVYTFEHSNVVLLGAFNEYCSISFLKGALLQDESGILSMPGENSQSARIIRFTSLSEILILESVLKNYIFEAVEVEKAGLKVPLKKIEERDIPEELQQKFEENPPFHAAFQALTPGRQRGYLMHFSAPKQTQTRVARIEKCMPLIFQGKGLND